MMAPQIRTALTTPARNAWSTGMRVAATAVVAAVVTSGGVMSASAAPAAPSSFSTSFEAADVQPLVSTPHGDPVNVTGARGLNGSILSHVQSVSASAENPPGEVASNLVDSSASTKWLAFQPTATITYTLDSPQTMVKYALTSANDASERDPKTFTIEGSTDGTTWTLVDSRANQTFASRGQVLEYAASSPAAYSRYRLNIVANNGGPLTQLADWNIMDDTNTPPPATPMTAVVGNGPVSGPTMKPIAGFSGTKALRYSGSHVADGPASASDVLYDNLDLTVGPDTVLSYKIFPELVGDLQYPSTYAAIDLVLDDGTRMSERATLTDAHGGKVGAADQGASKILYADQWNSVKFQLGSLAGRTVTDILVSYDNPAGHASTGFQGWIDDIDLNPAPTKIDGSAFVNYVDTRRGTMSTGGFSRGNNIPATALPNGFNFFTPMTNASSQTWLYDYARGNDGNNLPTLQGLGISHEPSPWMGDRNQLAFLPSLSATPNASLSSRALPFSHSNEIARPDLYSVKFNNGSAAEVTPTDHGAVMRFSFPGDTGSVIVDRVAGNSSLRVSSNGVVSGWVDGGSDGATRMFVYGVFDRSPAAVGTATGDREGARYASFATDDTKTVELRLATSFISLDQAHSNLDLEVTGRSFADVAQSAQKAWDDRLGVLEVEGASEDQLVTTYSSLYRLNLYPNSQYENVGTAASPVYKYASPVAPTTGDATDTTTNAKIVSGKIFVNNGFWDTYRTAWPAYSALYPKVAEELIDGFVQQYRDAGWIARWSSPGYADLMTGTSSDVAFADAYIKGVGSKTALEAYDAARKNATVLPTSSGVGRKGLDTSIFLGYTPSSTHESVSWALEGFINDYGIGMMGAKLAEDESVPAERRATLREESKYFLDRARGYTYLFDPSIGFFQARGADGTFQTPAANYDPENWGGAYTETNGWNFAFHAPFDVDGLAALYGGSKGLVGKLDEFFTTPEQADKPGGYGLPIHEMFEARDVRIGEWGMSNQVSHHIPYLYAEAGAPSKTQAIVRETTRRLFVGSDIGQGYPGDEDNGEMSSWYLFSALGFYPLAMGTDHYTIGSPLFSKATIHREGGDDFVIEANHNSTKNVYVQSATLNGKPLDRASLSQSAISNGGTLRFEMGPEASNWGAHTSDAKAPKPLLDATKAGLGTVTSSDGTALQNLTDDNSRSETTFGTATPAITWTSEQGPVTVASYTLTNTADGAAPTAWTLEGSSDGKTWVPVDKRTDQTFTWSTQTRPFQVAEPRALPFYRVTIDATKDNAPLRLAELELLADTTATPSDFTLTARSGVTGAPGVEVGGPLAVITGSAAAGDYTVTADFLDGSAPQAATLKASPLGSLEVRAPHTFDKPGSYTVRVTATDGVNMATTLVSVNVVRTAPTITGAFDSVCIGDPGAGGNCDQLNYAFSRSSLAESGFVQGTTVPVPGSALTFDLPAVKPGQPDNATGKGQVLPLNLGSDVTQLSVIGTATEKAQQTVGVVTFDDGSTMDLPIEFGDWTASRNAPLFGNVIVGTSQVRLSGDTATDGTPAVIFSTAPTTVPTGKKPVSLTLPTQTGDPRTAGRIHVFAVAADGTRPTPLSVTPGTVGEQRAGTPFTANLATAAGGSPTPGAGYTATVNWGDTTPVETAAVADGTISGSHTYRTAGTYAVAVTVDDGTQSATTSTTVTVAEPVAYTPTIALDPSSAVEPGATVQVTGSGFAPGESVQLTLNSDPVVTVDATTDSAGAFQASVTVPAGAVDGSYPLTAVGSVSAVAASATLEVHAVTPPDYHPTLRALAKVATRGERVQLTGEGYAPGEQVTLTLDPDGESLGTAVANADGVLDASIIVPQSAAMGRHDVTAVGAVSKSAASDHFAVKAVPGPDKGKAPTPPGTWNGIPVPKAKAPNLIEQWMDALGLGGRRH